MKVALVSDCYLPRLGGIEVQVHALATALVRAGHQVRLVTATPPGEAPSAGMPSGLRVERLLPPVPLPVPVNPWAGPALRRILAEVDVVHVHLGVVAPFAATAADIAQQVGVPTVLTWHSLPGHGVLPRVVARRWRRWVAGGALPTAVSREAAAQVGRLVRHQVVEVLPNGLEAAAWAPRAAAAPPDPDGSPVLPGRRPRIVTAMRFALRKRPVQAIRLVERVRAGLPPQLRPDLEIAGDGPWRAPVAALARHTSWGSWVDLPGRLAPERLAERYRAADLYLAPSRREGFGIAALEARAAGLPVVGYAGTGVADIVTGDLTGVLATGDDDLVEQVRALLADPGRLARMSEHLRSVPCAHDWDDVVAATEQAYLRAGAVTS